MRRRRLALNMTLEALGEAAGLTTTYVGEIEAPSRRPRGLSLDAAFRVADGLGAELPERIAVLALLRAVVAEKRSAR